MDTEIRAMLPSDWPAVREIYTKALLEGKSTFTTECPSYEEWDAAHCADCRFVISENGRVAGWCTILLNSPRPACTGDVSESIYIDPASRGRGLGKKLLSHLIIASEQAGYWCLYASIFSANKASVALHRSCGFRQIGYRERVARDRFGQWQDTTLMERRSRLL